MVTTSPLQGCATPLIDEYDVGLLDLDGVVYLGDEVVPHAADALSEAAAAGWRRAFVTNNALRPPGEVSAKLTRLGVPATPDEVVTSAQAAARVLALRLPPASRVLVIGGRGLREALAAVGLVAVTGADDHPVAVVSGHDPEQTWARLAEATLAIRSGVPWVASNTDATIPDRRGELPGAGAIVALLATAGGRGPDEIAGKPYPAMHAATIERTAAEHPLVVGDRLDTDIQGARAAGVDSLLVLTGVTDARSLLAAGVDQRPTYIAADLRGLLVPHLGVQFDDDGVAVTVGTARAHLIDSDHLTVVGDDAVDRLRAACALSWSRPIAPVDVTGLD